MKKMYFVLFVILVCSVLAVFAEETGCDAEKKSSESSDTSEYTYSIASSQKEPEYLYGTKFNDIFMADFTGFGLTFAATGLNFGVGGLLGLDGTYTLEDQILASSMTNLASIPLHFSGSPDVLPMTAVTLALTGAEYLAGTEYGLYSREHQWFYWAGNNLAMYNAYDAYASTRLRSPAWDNSSFKRFSSWDLLKAPFDFNNLKEPVVWAAMGSSVLFTALNVWLIDPEVLRAAVWETGEWYLDERQMTPQGFWLEYIPYVASSNTIGAIGEEGVYRGVLHEELSCRLGEKWATVVDTGAFAAMHIITDICRGCSWQYTTLHALDVAGANLLFDWAYDKGGLPLSIAAHAWANFIGNFMNAFLSYGIPQSKITN